MDLLIIGAVIAAIALLAFFIAVTFRVVVNTNEVHIVQSTKETKSYGKDSGNGNTYYEWPASLPRFGVTKVVLPMSVFDIRLNDFKAFDVGRVQFEIDVVGFFRIQDFNVAASRISSVEELHKQIEAILEGSIRSILAKSDIEEIMQERATFGVAFTKEVEAQLKAWGLVPVKPLELMDIRDTDGSEVIHNITLKKQSRIERESRVEVAENKKLAENAEIEAEREVALQKQQALEQIGVRTAAKDQAVGIAAEKSQQEIKEAARMTMEKEMAVRQVENVKTAEIQKQVNIVKAEEMKATDVVKAEGEKQKTVLIAEAEKEKTVLVADGKLVEAQRSAEGIKVEGTAKADAEKQMGLAKVQPQITLAEQIGSNSGYQTYLTSIRTIEANEAVGKEQARALEKADVKIIANAGGKIESGLKGVTGIFTPEGGTNLAGMLEGLAQGEEGKAVLDALVSKFTGTPAKPKAK